MRMKLFGLGGIVLGIVGVLIVLGCVRTKYVYVYQDGTRSERADDQRLRITVTDLKPPATQPAGELEAAWSSQGPLAAKALTQSPPLELSLTWQETGSIRRETLCISANEIDGLPIDAPSSPAQVRFAISKPAGRLLFDGTTDGHMGASGTVRFAPDAQFVSEIRELTQVELTPQRTFELLRSGPLPAYIRGLREAGYTVTLDEAITADRHYLRLDYAKAMKVAGYQFTIPQLIELDRHNIRADYAAGYKAAGYELSMSDLIELDRHNIRADYARGMKAAGFGLTVKDLIELDRHNIRSDYAKGMVDAGYKLTVADLIELDRHNTRVDYAKAVRQAGYDLTPADLIELDRNNVRPDFMAALHDPARPNLSVKQITELNRRGVDVATVKVIQGR